MENLVSFLRKITPEMLELLEKRYSILRNIYYEQPIGRRMLSIHMDMGERVVRRELDFLKERKLVDITPAGMQLRPEGVEVVQRLQDLMRELKGLHRLEEGLKNLLGIEEVHVVHGDSDREPSVKKDMGRIAASIIRQKMKEVSIIAVSGGSSVAEVAEQMPMLHVKNDIEVIPARGGLGEVAEYQANAIAAKLAGKMCGRYRLLYVPDNLSKEALEKVVREPAVAEVVNRIKKADILLFGIGRAQDMAVRRHLPRDTVDFLNASGAAAEALGFYFSDSGEIVHSSTSIGLNLKDYSNIPTAVAVAGGARKSGAIVAANLFRKKTVLVTDEGAAKEIIDRGNNTEG